MENLQFNNDIFNLKNSFIDKEGGKNVVRVLNPFPNNDFDANHNLMGICDEVERKYKDLEFTGEWKTIGDDFLFYFK